MSLPIYLVKPTYSENIYGYSDYVLLRIHCIENRDVEAKIFKLQDFGDGKIVYIPYEGEEK